MPDEPIVSIKKSEYDKLLKRDEWLSYLEQAGVDNWDGYSYAFELKEEQENKTNQTA